VARNTCLDLLVIDGALACLREAGIVHVENESVWASNAARGLDELELICV
jgi:hypothetical protein